MMDSFIPVVLEERIVSQDANSKAVWRLLSTPDGAGEWKPFIVAANGAIVSEPDDMPLPGTEAYFK